MLSQPGAPFALCITIMAPLASNRVAAIRQNLATKFAMPLFTARQCDLKTISHFSGSDKRPVYMRHYNIHAYGHPI